MAEYSEERKSPIEEVYDVFVDEVKKFISNFNYGKKEILRNMEDDYRRLLTDIPEEKIKSDKSLLEEEINEIGRILLSLDPKRVNEGSIKKFIDENYPNVRVKKGKVVYELKGHRFEIYKDFSGYWLSIYKDEELVTSRLFVLAYDLVKLIHILKLLLPFPSDKDYEKIIKVIHNIEELVEKRSETKVKKPRSLIKLLPDKVLKSFRMIRDMKEFYDLLDESMGGVTLDKLKKVDIQKYADEIIRAKFGTGVEKQIKGKSPEEYFDGVLKSKVYKSLEEENLPSVELQKAKESLDKAREKILSFGVLEADSVTVEQILFQVDNPYRCIEIIEKMTEDLANNIISGILEKVTVKDKKLALKLAELVKAAQESNVKHVVEGFNNIGFELLSKIIETQKDQSYDVMLFTDICQILPVEILRKGYDEKIDKNIVNLNEIQSNQQQAFRQYDEMEQEGKDIAVKMYKEMEADIYNIMQDIDVPFEERIKKVNDIASDKVSKLAIERLEKERKNANE